MKLEGLKLIATAILRTDGLVVAVSYTRKDERKIVTPTLRRLYQAEVNSEMSGAILGFGVTIMTSGLSQGWKEVSSAKERLTWEGCGALTIDGLRPAHRGEKRVTPEELYDKYEQIRAYWKQAQPTLS